MGDYPWRGTDENRKRLDAALNDIMKWVCDELPEGWEIEIKMTGGVDFEGEASIELIDPDGNEVSKDWDGERRNVWDMVDKARNPEEEQ